MPVPAHADHKDRSAYVLPANLGVSHPSPALPPAQFTGLRQDERGDRSPASGSSRPPPGRPTQHSNRFEAERCPATKPGRRDPRDISPSAVEAALPHAFQTVPERMEQSHPDRSRGSSVCRRVVHSDPSYKCDHRNRTRTAAGGLMHVTRHPIAAPGTRPSRKAVPAFRRPFPTRGRPDRVRKAAGNDPGHSRRCDQFAEQPRPAGSISFGFMTLARQVVAAGRALSGWSRTRGTTSCGKPAVNAAATVPIPPL